jgi:hypothetical protein
MLSHLKAFVSILHYAFAKIKSRKIPAFSATELKTAYGYTETEAAFAFAILNRSSIWTTPQKKSSQN